MTRETYKSQNRGGVGIKGMATNEEDYVENIISMSTHDYIMFFTNKGKVYRIKGYEVPSFSRQSKGLPIINLLPIEKDEKIKAMLNVENDDNEGFVVFCTQNGLVKRTNISEFENIRSNGKIAITLRENDELISVQKTNGNNEILIASSNGRMIRFIEDEIRVMGRSAAGVKGIDVGDGICVGCEIAIPGQNVLVATENGYGKQTDIDEYRMTHRGSKGVKALNVTSKNGNIVGFKTLNGDEDLMIVTNNGIIIRMDCRQISQTGRVAQGVKLINLKESQSVSTIAILEKEDVSEEGDIGTQENIPENNAVEQ
jgi:DNA gyrase subunit A